MRISSKMLCIFLVMLFVISGCAAMTTVNSNAPNASIRIKEKYYYSQPVEDWFEVTTFGDYEFLIEEEGYQPLYGVLPLHINSRNLLFDIFLFFPAALFNLREVYPYYNIDVDRKIIHYSLDGKEWWKSYIQPKESEQARQYFEYGNQNAIYPSAQQQPRF